ncbi:phage baseplate assembly protein V [Nibrella viscosa]|uniref:Phage baseplate assembly protein V n=1 Tax=Nibrella viscosa TaxID=1084524 RepID=A0ABP8JSI4_9BACT
MAKLVKVKVELEDGTELNQCDYLLIEQDLFGHHTFELHVPFEELEKPDELFFNQSPRNLCGKTIRFSFDPVLDDESFSFRFKGIVTDLNLKNTSRLSNRFIIRGYSPTILLEDSRLRRTFLGQNIQSIANKVFDPYPSNLIRKTIQPRHSDSLPYSVQYDETNFAFLSRLAAQHGEWCYYDGQQLVFGEPKGQSIDFLVDGTQTFDMSLRLMPTRFLYSSYDYRADQRYESHSKDQSVSGLGQWGDFTLDESDKAFSQESQLPATKPVHSQQELDSLAKTRKIAETTQLIDFRGTGENPDLTVGTVVKVKANRITERGESEENLGNYRVTHVTHQVDSSGNYSNTFRAVPESVDGPPPNSNVANPLGQPEIAKVIDNQDPDKLGRVKVEFMWAGDAKESDWIRVAHPYTGAGMGMLFVPEEDSQVMIGYEGNLAELPFVLTGLYPKNDNFSYTSRDNTQKIIKTKGGNQIELIDKDGEQKIQITNDNQTDTRLLLSFSDNGSITLETQGPVKIAGRDIEVKASNDLTLEAQSNLVLKATQKIAIEGQIEVTIKTAQFAAKADATAELKANGQTTVEGTQTSVKGNALVEVKGALVTIN